MDEIERVSPYRLQTGFFPIPKLTKLPPSRPWWTYCAPKVGRLDDANAHGVARLLSGKKSTVHNAVTGLIASGVVVKAGGALMLAA
jgi:hypothetical protein